MKCSSLGSPFHLQDDDEDDDDFLEEDEFDEDDIDAEDEEEEDEEEEDGTWYVCPSKASVAAPSLDFHDRNSYTPPQAASKS